MSPRRAAHPASARQDQGGFTLVEAMVTLVVLAVGMLGIAGLYVTTLKSGGGAIYRMQAVNLASDLADRIRANRTANLAYLGAAVDNNCYGAGAIDCTPAQMAGNDLFVWQQQVANILPAGLTNVNVVLTPGTASLYSYTITVSWSEPGAAAALNYTLNFQI